jgi:hypothetical protein
MTVLKGYGNIKLKESNEVDDFVNARKGLVQQAAVVDAATRLFFRSGISLAAPAQLSRNR